MIENIIIQTDHGEIDFQAQGYDPEVLGHTEESVRFIHPVTRDEVHAVCEISAGAAIIFE